MFDILNEIVKPLNKFSNQIYVSVYKDYVRFNTGEEKEKTKNLPSLLERQCFSSFTSI